MYRQFVQANFTVIKNYLIQDWFFNDSTRVMYDANKIMLFNILYCSGAEKEKVNFLYNMVESSKHGFIPNKSSKLLAIL